MRRDLIALAALVLTAPVVAAASPPPFRIAAPGPAAACAPLAAGAPAGEKAYHDHLSRRLGRPVLRCHFPDRAAAGAALAAGRVDMAWLDAAAYAPVSGQVRALLTVRAGAQSNRIPIYVAVRADDPARDLAALRGRRIAFGGRSPAGLATPRAVLSERGLPAGSFQEMLSAEGDAAVAALRGRTADAIAVHGAAWERVCRKVSPKDPDPCRDLRVLRVARPRAEAALAIRRDTPNDLRYRLIGIHMALHLEAPAAFAFAAGRSDAAEFQPAEAEALTLANLR